MRRCANWLAVHPAPSENGSDDYRRPAGEDRDATLLQPDQATDKTLRAYCARAAIGTGIRRWHGAAGLVLQTLLRLKQICNHPSQLSGDGVQARRQWQIPPAGRDLRRTCRTPGEGVNFYAVPRDHRPAGGPPGRSSVGGVVLHGGTGVQQRKSLVDHFQSDDGPPFFILSLRAGGTGLNLTAASHVIHFDRWWNPAVENQATDRAFRIGQQRNVLVHTFITSGTIEERIDALLAENGNLPTTF